jgi:hypothetical protein
VLTTGGSGGTISTFSTYAYLSGDYAFFFSYFSIKELRDGKTLACFFF